MHNSNLDTQITFSDQKLTNHAAGKCQPPFLMFWLCLQLNSFWQSIFKTFSDVLEVPIEPSATTAVFGVVPQELHLNRQAKIIIAFAPLLARRRILLNWKDKFPPNVQLWIKDLLHHLTLENIHYSTRGCAQKFYDIWQPFLAYFEKMAILFLQN